MRAYVTEIMALQGFCLQMFVFALLEKPQKEYDPLL